jgi:hypothetical protein
VNMRFTKAYTRISSGYSEIKSTIEAIQRKNRLDINGAIELWISQYAKSPDELRAIQTYFPSSVDIIQRHLVEDFGVR